MGISRVTIWAMGVIKLYLLSPLDPPSMEAFENKGASGTGV